MSCRPAAAAVVASCSWAVCPGETGLGEKLAVSPAGNAPVLRLTGLSKSSRLPMLRAKLALEGAHVVWLTTGTLRVKSGSPLLVQTGRVPQAMPWASKAALTAMIASERAAR